MYVLIDMMGANYPFFQCWQVINPVFFKIMTEGSEDCRNSPDFQLGRRVLASGSYFKLYFLYREAGKNPKIVR
jgi:hypothetical protein